MSVTVKTKSYPDHLVDKLEPEKFYEIKDEYGYYKNHEKKYPDYEISMTYEGTDYDLFCVVPIDEIEGVLSHIYWAIGDDPDNDNYEPEEINYIEYLKNKLKEPGIVDKIRKYILYEELEIEIELY